jgi:hypothetical protein
MQLQGGPLPDQPEGDQPRKPRRGRNTTPTSTFKGKLSCTHALNSQPRWSLPPPPPVDRTGVHWASASNQWTATISSRGVTRVLGLYETEEDAARAYDE